MVQVSGVCLHVGVENVRVVGKVSLELVRKKKKATMRVVEREVGYRASILEFATMPELG